MLRINHNTWLALNELQFSFIRSPGPGGQNVNKLATAVLLRFDIVHSSLPEATKTRLLHVLQNRLTNHNELIIKASRFRTQERNRQDAIERLIDLLKKSITPPKPRKKTKPTRSSIEKRIEKKKHKGEKKSLRGKIW